MGYIRHHAIVVTGYNAELMATARDMAMELGLVVTATMPGSNGYLSLCVLPDGSREGWWRSNESDYGRDELIEWLSSKPTLHWAELSFGGGGGPPELIRWSR